jgi:two-component system, sensor histidine kinase YesM
MVHAIRSTLFRFSMTRKWLLTYIGLIVLPASIIVFGYYKHTVALLEDGVAQSMQETMKQAAINLSYRLERVQDISNSAIMNPKLYEYLEKSRESSPIGSRLESLKELGTLVKNVETSNDVFRFRLFVDRSKLFAGDQINFFDIEGLRQRPWYEPIVESNGGIVWTRVYSEYYLDRGEESVFSSARLIHDPIHFDELGGVLMIDVSDKMFGEILSDLALTKQSLIYLADTNGTIVYHPDKMWIGTSLQQQMRELVTAADEGKPSVQTNTDKSYIIFSTVRSTGWKLIAEIPAAEISRSAIKQNQFSSIAALLGIFLLFLLLVFIMLAVLIRGMNRRVQQVIGVIRRDGIERLDELQPAVGGDFNLLERSVDQLILRVRQLVEQAYAARVHEREAQLRALQAQINPHFLYNTLDTINWIAIGRGANDISQMIDALAKYFRLSLNKGKDKVSIEDELNLARVYLDIQQSRFPGSFKYVVEGDPDVLPFVIPKLTLQPIVENALLHGIRKSKKKRGIIRITAVLEDRDVVLTVSDDGIGMEEERAQRLLVEEPAAVRPAGGEGSYGLFNVNERIRLYAGEGYGLTIHSRLGEGTQVTVRLQARTLEQTASPSV